MNTNRSWYSLSKADVDSYRHFFNNIFEPSVIQEHLLFQEHNSIPNKTRRVPLVDYVEFKSFMKPEVGTKLSRFHVHLTINLVLKAHPDWGLPKFNASLVRELYSEHYGRQLHVNVRGVKDVQSAMRHYVGKSAPQEEHCPVQ
jgi:hypothetical protein